MEKSPSMNISICIPTRDRPDDLSECIKAIFASSVPALEIVVSDDSTDDRTRLMLETRYPHVTYVSGPRKGLGPNRNSAIEAATGEWILFLDDDARLGADFLANMSPMLIACGDRREILTGAEQREPGGLIFPHDQTFLGFQSRVYEQAEKINTVVINATLFPADLFELVRFDDRLIYGYDEVDIAARARAEGYDILLCPTAINLHRPSPVNRDYYRPHTEAARIYVTFKKYLATQHKPLKSLAFLVASFLHTISYFLRRQGIRGLPSAIALHRKAWRDIWACWRETVQLRERRPQSSHMAAPRPPGAAI